MSLIATACLVTFGRAVTGMRGRLLNYRRLQVLLSSMSILCLTVTLVRIRSLLCA